MTDNDLEFLKIDLKGIKKIAIQMLIADSFPDLFSFKNTKKKPIHTGLYFLF